MPFLWSSLHVTAAPTQRNAMPQIQTLHCRYCSVQILQHCRQLWVQATECHVLLQGHLLLQRCWEETAVAGNVSSLAEPQSLQHCSWLYARSAVSWWKARGYWAVICHSWVSASPEPKIIRPLKAITIRASNKGSQIFHNHG